MLGKNLKDVYECSKKLMEAVKNLENSDEVKFYKDFYNNKSLILELIESKIKDLQHNIEVMNTPKHRLRAKFYNINKSLIRYGLHTDLRETYYLEVSEPYMDHGGGWEVEESITDAVHKISQLKRIIKSFNTN